MLTMIGLSGSLRQGSFNSSHCCAAGGLCPAAGAAPSNNLTPRRDLARHRLRRRRSMVWPTRVPASTLGHLRPTIQHPALAAVRRCLSIALPLTGNTPICTWASASSSQGFRSGQSLIQPMATGCNDATAEQIAQPRQLGDALPRSALHHADCFRQSAAIRVRCALPPRWRSCTGGWSTATSAWLRSATLVMTPCRAMQSLQRHTAITSRSAAMLDASWSLC